MEEYNVISNPPYHTGNVEKVAIVFNYDSLERLTQKLYTISGSSSFTNKVVILYNDNVNQASSQIRSYSSQIGSSTATAYNYTYDSNGNITSIVDNNQKTTRYVYDDLGQLIREDNPYYNKTYVYTYDNNGNRTSKKTYAYTTGTLGAVTATQTYTYGDASWGDRLTKYGNASITYDAIGNPLTYNNGTAYTFTWKDGRRLATATKGGRVYSFEYNDEGIRTSKTSAGVKHTYVLDVSRIVSEQWSNNFIAYFYDESGTPIGMQYRTSSYGIGEFDTFYFEKNLQGDIVAVYNESGTKLVSYTYDAWGNFTTTYYNSGSSTAAKHNPFRYRGYYYDTDLGLYYLNSRYYDSNTGRFINADEYTVIGATPMALTDKNLYAYCDNNPVTRADGDGEFWHIVVGAAAGALIGGIVKVVSNVIEGKSLTDELATAMLAGAASGALASTGVGIVGMVVGNAAISMVENATNQVVENNGFNNFDVGDMLIDCVIGGVSGALGGAGKGTKHLTNLGNQTVKRTFNATTNRGLKAGLNEASKALAYYGKNSAKYYKAFIKAIPADFILEMGTTIASSSYMKYQYRSVYAR